MRSPQYPLLSLADTPHVIHVDSFPFALVTDIVGTVLSILIGIHHAVLQFHTLSQIFQYTVTFLSKDHVAG